MAQKCSSVKSDGTKCNAYTIEGSDKCWFHTSSVSDKRKPIIDMATAVISRKKNLLSYEKIFGKSLGERPRADKLKELEKFYDDGGVIAAALDSYVSVLTANGFQFIDTKTGERNTDNTKILDELDQRVNFHITFEKIARAMLISGFCWGEMIYDGNKMSGLLFLPPYEIDIDRKEDSTLKAVRQVRGGKTLGEWRGDKLNDIFFINLGIKHSEAFGVGLLEKVYSEAKEWKDQGKDLGAVTKFVSYPFRVVKVGSDMYPASEESVIDVGNKVEDLEPGDWLATRHNIAFEFESPEVPDALVNNYKERTRQLIVSLGVPSMYMSLADIDAGTLKEIRSIFNSTIKSLQIDLISQFEEQVIKRQLEKLGKQKLRTDLPAARIVWNPLTVSVLSILELTQLVAAGVVSLEEARRIIESMGYGLLKGDQWEKEMKQLREPLKAPKETHPTEENPEKPPNKPPATDTEPIKTKTPVQQPIIKRPQPNAPVLGFQQWLEGIKALGELDKYSAATLLKTRLMEGFENDEGNNKEDDINDKKV